MLTPTTACGLPGGHRLLSSALGRCPWDTLRHNCTHWPLHDPNGNHPPRTALLAACSAGTTPRWMLSLTCPATPLRLK